MQRNVRDLEEQDVSKAADNHNAPRSVLGNLTNTIATTAAELLASTFTSLIIYMYCNINFNKEYN